MKNFFILIGLFVVSLAELQQYDPVIAKTVLSLLDTTVNPCDNFYNFACGTWIKNTPLPADKSRLDRSFNGIADHNNDILLQILQNSTLTKLSTFYNSCMDTTAIDKLSFKPIEEDLTIVDEANDRYSIMDVVARLSLRGVDTFFMMSPVMDAKNPKWNIAEFDQGGLGLPFPSLYTANDTDSSQLRQEYIKHITNMFALLGDPYPRASANLAYALESAIAEFTVPADQLTDPFTTYNKMTRAQFQLLSPDIIWENYFNRMFDIGIDIENITVTVPSFFSNLSDIMSDYQQNWASYLTWNVLRVRSPLLSQPFRDEHFNFYNRILNGQQQPSPRWELCIDFVDFSLGELLGKYFAEIAFPGNSEKDALDELSNIVSAMQYDINNIQWMSNVTRSRALQKLSLVTHLIGAPNNPDNYNGVTVGSQFFTNILNAIKYERLKSYTTIGKPSDKMAWEMTAPTVNAYYDPSKNQMVFPAGILQQPFFNVSYPTSMNYGGIGLVMGHELTHGFDNQGRLYDGNGVLTNWWDNSTDAKFTSKVQCVINQYSKFEVLPGVFINGELTQGENIADMGGIKNSFHAYSQLENITSPSIVPGYNNGQLFFISFAQTWCEVASDAFRRVQVKTDPHSPAPFRVLGPLMNLPAFADVFKCPVGSHMNNPSERCEVW